MSNIVWNTWFAQMLVIAVGSLWKEKYFKVCLMFMAPSEKFETDEYKTINRLWPLWQALS